MVCVLIDTIDYGCKMSSIDIDWSYKARLNGILQASFLSCWDDWILHLDMTDPASSDSQRYL